MNRTMTFPAKKDADAGPDIEIRRKNKQNEAINQMYKAVMNLKKDYLKIFVKVRFNHRMLHHAKKSTLLSAFFAFECDPYAFEPTAHTALCRPLHFLQISSVLLSCTLLPARMGSRARPRARQARL